MREIFFFFFGEDGEILIQFCFEKEENTRIID
jgi:hypothetical protein